MNTIRTLLITAVLSLIVAVSQAQIILTLAPSSLLPVTPGGSISWSGTLTNTGLDALPGASRWGAGCHLCHGSPGDYSVAHYPR